MEALLALEDGTVYRGKGFGHAATACGEVCFNTSMTGYQEILTDPSYRAQIVAMTYPQIGNYGINDEDVESWRIHLSGLVVRELSPVTSSWRSKRSLADYLRRSRVPGIEGIDTRALTRRLRLRGAMKGALIAGARTGDEEAVAVARAWPGLAGVDYVREVTHKEPPGKDGALPGLPAPAKLPPAEIPIVALDLGIKYNILRQLRQHGFETDVVPAGATAREILDRRPSGVFLSNGPGDPEAVGYAIATARELIGHGIPMFGICLGHQMLGLAMGGKTFKLKFGHRGANHPVRHQETGRIEITSQNHGYALEKDSLPSEVQVDRINLNDGTVEGLRHRKRPVFGVQYHPEAAPGPHDSTPLFQEFRELVGKAP